MIKYQLIVMSNFEIPTILTPTAIEVEMLKSLPAQDAKELETAIISIKYIALMFVHQAASGGENAGQIFTKASWDAFIKNTINKSANYFQQLPELHGALIDFINQVTAEKKKNNELI